MSSAVNRLRSRYQVAPQADESLSDMWDHEEKDISILSTQPMAWNVVTV